MLSDGFIVEDGPGSGNLQEDDLWVESLIIQNIKALYLAVDGKKMLNMHCVLVMKGNFDWQREKLTEQQYVNQLKKAGIPIEDVAGSSRLFFMA